MCRFYSDALGQNSRDVGGGGGKYKLKGATKAQFRNSKGKGDKPTPCEVNPHFSAIPRPLLIHVPIISSY